MDNQDSKTNSRTRRYLTPKIAQEYFNSAPNKEIIKGNFQVVKENGIKTDATRTQLSAAIGVHGLVKKAETAATVGSAWRNGSTGGTARQGPNLYSPLWLTSNTQLPRDRLTMNSWARAYFALHPVVNNAINLHATYPISKMNIRCPDKKIEDFFNAMAEEMELHNKCVEIAQEFFVIGECFPYLELDERRGVWSRIVIQNPDYIYVRRTVISGEPVITLRPDSELRRIITGTDPDSARLRKNIPPNIVQFVRSGRDIPLDNFYVSHLARKISPYDTRGTSMIAPVFKSLMLWDKLREAKYAQSDSMINPITLVKIGGGSVDSEYKISPADLEYWRNLLSDAQYDPDFKIITHGSVDIQKVSSNVVIDINPDLERIMKEIYIGLMVPQVIMESGDVTYTSGGLSLDVLRQRYLQFQNLISKWIRRKVFAPIAQLNDFWENVDGDKRLIIPEVEWNHMSLFDLSDYIQFLVGLATSGERKIVSEHSLFRSLGLDYENEQRMIRHELISETIRAKEIESLNRMSLTELRGLDVNSEVPDIPDIPSPDETPEEPVPGEQPEGGGGELGGMMGGGMPSMPPPPPPPPSPKPGGGGGEGSPTRSPRL